MSPSSPSIAGAMLPFPSTVDGQPVQDASPKIWGRALRELAYWGFDTVDLTDSWLRVGDLSTARLAELAAVVREAGLDPVAVSAIRRSVIDPHDADDNLAYTHRTLDAAAELGCRVVSIGFHRPLTPAQREALWFWTFDGPVDDTDPETWTRAVERVRELGRHADQLGLALSLEMYEDTLLGSAASAARLVDDVGLESVGLNPDLGNLYRLHRPVDDFLESFAICAPRMNYWHVKNYARVEDHERGLVASVPAPMSSGSMNYRAAVALAWEAGFTGPYCVEHYGGDGLAVMAENRDYLQRLWRWNEGETEHAHAG